MRKYTCVIVDDHLPSRKILEDYIGYLPKLSIENIFSGALDAHDILQNFTPDILFLDVEMPILSGFEFLKILKKRPHIILTTAHAGYAKDGFDEGVVDFLHKPYSFDRFLIAVNRVIDTTAIQIEPIKEKPTFIYFKDGIQLVKVELSDILYIEAYGNYSKIHMTNDKVEMFTESLSNIEKKLSDLDFSRIHKSYIISKSKIKSIGNKSIFVNQTELPIGVIFRANLV